MTQKNDVLEFSRAKLAFSLNRYSGQFEHNFNRDLHLFVIWEGALEGRDDILTDLGEEFLIRSVHEIQWSSPHLGRNASRLYKRVHLGASSAPPKIGGGRFTAVVVEDPKPTYAYGRSVSGLYECVNTKVTDRKTRYRSWFESEYAVHSTNSLGEFFEQAPLILGFHEMERALQADKPALEIISTKGDTTGIGGWDDFAQMFRFLNLTTNSIVLRGFDVFPDAEPGAIEEIDFLCEDLPGFLAAINADIVDRHRPYKCRIRVGEHVIRVDARYIGDGYYDPLWERDLLDNQVFHMNVVARPRRDDHFFSLLYHCKVQKPNVGEREKSLLLNEASAIGLNNLSAFSISSDEEAGAILTGFMQSRGYRYMKPLDPGVLSRRAMLRHLHGVMPEKPHWRRRIGRTVHMLISRLLPRGLKSRIPPHWKSRIAKSLGR